MHTSVIVNAPAKTNLFLFIGPLREDNYHDVTTVMCPLTLHDTITLTPLTAGDAPQVELEMSFEGISPIVIDPAQNLVTRAVTSMCAAFDRRGERFSVHLTKRIPSGAGLGGGSSDAAATLVALAQVWGIAFTDERLFEVAASLGADVPYFLQGGAALMDDRGDRFVRSFPAPDIPAVVIKPEQSVFTAEAYATFDVFAKAMTQEQAEASGATMTSSFLGLLSALEEGDIKKICANVYNNMTDAACEIAPQIKNILLATNSISGVRGSFVSGSGSAVVVLCEDAKSVEKVARIAEASEYWYAVASTTERGVAIEIDAIT